MRPCASAWFKNDAKVEHVSVAPDDDLVATTGPRWLRVWRLHNNKQQGKSEVRRLPLSFLFSDFCPPPLAPILEFPVPLPSSPVFLFLSNFVPPCAPQG